MLQQSENIKFTSSHVYFYPSSWRFLQKGYVFVQRDFKMQNKIMLYQKYRGQKCGALDMCLMAHVHCTFAKPRDI